MANIAEQLIGQAMETAGTTPDMTAGINQGAQLAQNIEQMQMKRQQLEMQKQEHEMQKIDKLTSAMEAGAKMKSKSARNAYFKNYIPQMQKALGLTEFIPPETMEMIKADPEEAKKFSLLKAKIMNGDITFDEAVAQMQPEEWAAMDEAEVQQLEASEKFRVQQAGASERAGAPNERLERQFERREEAKLNNDVRMAFKPIEDRRNTLRTANDSLLSVKDALIKGKKVSSIDFNVAARALAKAFNSGAMTDEDVNDFKRLSGVEDITESNIKKYITGGAPKEAVVALSRIAERSASNLDKQAETIRAGFEERLQSFPDINKARKASGLTAYSKSTLQKNDGKLYKLPNGKSYSADQIRLMLMNNPALKEKIDAKTLTEIGAN